MSRNLLLGLHFGKPISGLSLNPRPDPCTPHGCQSGRPFAIHPPPPQPPLPPGPATLRRVLAGEAAPGSAAELAAWNEALLEAAQKTGRWAELRSVLQASPRPGGCFG